ncbi:MULTISPECIES: hypothetical protein [unclassified Streptomyces]|uniref:hypothetical protein n=1 Tax=unclassified Streptomyces TaxID=2593676 RepID=UPI0036F8B765
MQTETLVGLISGLGGAVIGAGGALLGGWLQQHHQAKTARRERQESYSRVAGERALDALVQIQQVVFEHTRDHPEGTTLLEHKAQVIDRVVEHAHTSRTSSMLIMRAPELRGRLDEVFMVLLKFHCAPVVESEPPSRTRNTWLLTASQEGLDVLSAALRDEQLPDHSEGFVEQMIIAANDFLDPS